MGIPEKSCGRCEHYVRGKPPEVTTWIRQHGHCYRGDQDAKPYPTHANSRGCTKFVGIDFVGRLKGTAHAGE